jgi:DNA polymerase I-like protein with 3'-5' exonuclease and polymerase domains
MARKAERVAVVDFETRPVGGYRPDQYPPKPVGVSIRLPGEKKQRYWAFGHPTENNCTEAQAKAALSDVWKSGAPVAFHHGKFDQDVAEKHWGLSLLPPERYHDTVFLLALSDPYSPDLKLKSAAHRLLGLPPDERDAIREWAIAQKLMPRNKKEAGEFIHLAPGKLVGEYADGDVLRTAKLFDLLHKRVCEDGMGEAYLRERRLMPVILRNEREGVRADLGLLRAESLKYGGAKDAEKYSDLGDLSGGAQDVVDAWIRKALRSKNLNVDSDVDLADALVKAKKADEGLFLLTPGGKRSTSKDSLIGAVTDPKVLGALQYRSRLGTAKGTFLLPWLREAEHTDGIVHPSWNQVRQYGFGGDAGAKTGRLSASRFMNVPKPFVERIGATGKYKHPDHIPGLPELPAVRAYLLPDKGELWLKRDYAQQELRVLGHFEDGVLMENYLSNPKLDVHQLAAEMVCEMLGIPLAPDMRDKMKTIGFGLLYGMGLGSLAERMDVDVATAKRLKGAYLAIFPGLADLQADLTLRGKTGLPLRTWGGRVYYAEEPKYSEKFGRVQSFEYRLLNYLIQGSSADCTKEALIRYDAARKHGRFLITVHDEINISVPKKALKQEAQILREVMASVEFDVPMLSDAKFGESWASLQKLEEPSWLPERMAA